MADITELDYANSNPIIGRSQTELELDLSTPAKQQFATYIAATLEAMIDPAEELGWSTPQARREACVQLAAKFDAAVDAITTPEAGQIITCPDDQFAPSEPEAHHPVTSPEFLSAVGHHPGTPVAGDEVMTSIAPLLPGELKNKGEKPPPQHIEGELAQLSATEEAIPLVESPACEPARTASDARVRVNAESAVSSDPSVPSGCFPVREECATYGGHLVEQLEQLYRAHLKLDIGLFLVFALWTLHTYFFELFAVTAYIWLHSPTAGCGKTTTADLLAYSSRNSQFTVNISMAALYHVIDQEHPTLIMDEAEGDLDDREMRSLINAGYRRNGGDVKRWIRGTLRSFSVYCPKVIASIRPIPDTVFDRCIKVELKRLRDDEEVAQFDSSTADGVLPAAIRDWAAFHGEAIGKLYQALPDPPFLHAREATLWKPLFAIAEYVCPARVPELTQTVLRLKEEKTLHGQETAPETKLLCDIRTVFYSSPNRKLATEALLKGLANLPESRWRGLDSLALANKLRPFDIRPKQLWLHGKNFRGYDIDDFQDAFQRYLTAVPVIITQLKREA